MFFVTNRHLFICNFEFEQRDYIIAHELGSNWPAYERRKFFCAQCDVLFNLHNAQLIPPAFCLHWKDVMNAVPIDSEGGEG